MTCEAVRPSLSPCGRGVRGEAVGARAACAGDMRRLAPALSRKGRGEAPPMKSVLPLATVLARPVRRLVRRRGADERLVATRRLRQRGPDRLYDRRSRRRVAQHGAARSCRRRIRSSPNSTSSSSQTAPTSKRSLIYHAAITLEETLIGFLIGAALGIGLAVAIVSVRMLERSLMPWIVASQTVPIIALAPMIVVILNQFDITGIDAEGGDRGLSLVLSDHGRAWSKACVRRIRCNSI